MHRLFVAVRPPKPIRDLLLGTMGGVSGVRWQTDEQIHLTLRFVGDVDRRRADDLDAALGAVHHPRFEIALSGLGTFERRGQPAAVWAGVTPHAPLKSLHKKIDQAAVRAGLEPERRAYVPHITLARLKHGSGPVRHLLESSGGLLTAPFAIDAFFLFESRLTPEGAVYSALQRYFLD